MEVGIGGSEVAGGSVLLKDVSEAEGARLWRPCCVSDEEYFELDSLLNGEPVEVLKDWSDVVIVVHDPSHFQVCGAFLP